MERGENKRSVFSLPLYCLFLSQGDPPSNEVPEGVYPTVVRRADGKALVVQCFTWAKYLCVLHVTFDDEGNVISYRGNPQLQDSSVEQGEGYTYLLGS